MTSGMPYATLASIPPRCAYHVWQWTTSAVTGSATNPRHRLNAAHTGRSCCGVADRSLATGNPRTRSEPSLMSCSPNVRTSTSISFASSRVRYSTWTPAPPYTFGGYSLVRIRACIDPA
jgi:hypothetical protein